jgi:hypothetical protein
LFFIVSKTTQIFRPDLTERDYQLMRVDLKVLRNWRAHPTASPTVQSVLAYFSTAAQSTPHIGMDRWQAFTDTEKRTYLILVLESIVR